MSTLVINAPSADPVEPEITSSDFWPPIEPANIREQQRIDNTIAPPRLKAALIEAIATTNGSLRNWRLAQQTFGIQNMAAIEAEQIDGESILLHRYRRAVGCLAKALLLERYRDFDATGKGDKKAEALADPIDDCRRDHLAAIADIEGRPRTTVELI